jgi:MFS family permease
MFLSPPVERNKGKLVPAMIRTLRDNPMIVALGASLFAGMLASSFLSLYLAVNFAEQGFRAIVGYLEGWLVTAGFILFPAFSLLIKKTSVRIVVIAAVACQIAGMVLMIALYGDRSPWIVGFMVALFATGYWQMHHLAMAQHTSSERRGMEISFLAGVSQIGTLIGAASGGLLAAAPTAFHPQYIAFILQFLATCGLGLTMPRARLTEDVDGNARTLSRENFWTALGKYPRQNLGVMVEAMHELIFSFLLSVWLISTGFPVILLGALRIIGSLTGFMLMPVCGRLIHRRKGLEFKISALTGTAGWSMVAIAPIVPVIIVASFLWPLSALFLKTGLESRWYSRRSSTQILVREVILTCVRIPCIVVFAWFATLHTTIYPIVGILISLLVLPYGAYLLRSERESEI